MHEEAFIRSILANPKDDVARQIYADWLESQGNVFASAKAEFLRITAELAGMKKKATKRAQRHLRQLGAKLPQGWLAVVSRMMIENCHGQRTQKHTLRFDFICDRGWQDLQTTDDRKVRNCDGCQQQVHYCDTIDDAREHASQGHCVAVDIGITRRPGDLQPRFMTLGMISSESVDP